MTTKKANSRLGRLFRAIKHWWFYVPDEAYKPTDRSLIDWVYKLLAEYDENYARRVGTLSPYAQQAAAIVEEEGRKRAPVLESEVRILALTVDKLAKHVDALERSIINHAERGRENKR